MVKTQPEGLCGSMPKPATLTVQAQGNNTSPRSMVHCLADQLAQLDGHISHTPTGPDSYTLQGCLEVGFI
jgi:hypothetical protein